MNAQVLRGENLCGGPVRASAVTRNLLTTEAVVVFHVYKHDCPCSTYTVAVCIGALSIIDD